MKVSKRIALIADDDEVFRMALATILTGKPRFAEVVQPASLDEAIEKLSTRTNISLALFDLAMSGMESPAYLRAVRDCFETLRVAVVSSSKNRQDILSALEAGVRRPGAPGAGKVQQGDRPRSRSRRGDGEGPHGHVVPQPWAGCSHAGRPGQPLTRRHRQMDPRRHGAASRQPLAYLHRPAMNRQGMAIADPAGAGRAREQMGRRRHAVRVLDRRHPRSVHSAAAARPSTIACAAVHRCRDRPDRTALSGAWTADGSATACC